MSGIPFQQIPAGLQVPLFYAELDPSHANTAQQVQRTLIIGQTLAGSFLTPNVPDISSGAQDAIFKAGAGSLLALMTAAYRAFDTVGEVWYGPLADNVGGTKATGSILFTGAATAAGTLSLYIAGQLVQVPITSGMSAIAAATATQNAVNAIKSMPVFAASGGTATVTFTANHKGEIGNDIDIRLNYRGYRSGEVTPAGLAPTITAMSGGATNPVLTTLLANLVDEPFDFIVSPYTDTTSIAAISAFLSDNGGRWSWATQVYGHCFIAYRGTLSAITTLSATLNDQHLSLMGIPGGPTPNWLWSAAYAAAAAVSARADPAMPIRGVAMPAVLAPILSVRFSLSNRNTLLSSGVSTFLVDQAGNVSTERLVTTYQTDQYGNPDNSYQSLETMFTLMAVLRALKASVVANFSQSKLADDGTRFAPGSNIVTPSIIRGQIIADYRALEYQGLVQNSAGFAAGLIVQRNATNPNRVDVLYPADLINQLDIFAALVQFING